MSGQSKSVKVIVVYPSDPLGPKVGGIQTFLRGFIRYAPEDFAISFVGVTSEPGSRKVRKWSKSEYRGREFDFYPLFYERDENKKTKIPLSLRFTAALIKERLYFQKGVLLFNRIEPAIAFRGSDLPKVGFVHNDILQQISEPGGEVFWRHFPCIYFSFEKHIFPYFDNIFSVNTRTLSLYQEKYPDIGDKFGFVPTWVDPQVFYPVSLQVRLELRKALAAKYPGLEPSKKWILFVGRLQKQKAPFRLIDVFTHYRKHGEGGAQMIIVGDGNLKDPFMRYVRKSGAKNDVFHISALKQDKLARLYSTCDTLLLTSNYEGMPRCVLEALGSGLPVVTTDVGEVGRVVKNGFSGEIADSFSVSDISAAMNRVLSAPEIYTSENCLRSVAEYTPQNVLTPVYETFRNLQYKYDSRNDG